jgi:hypothetical protein
MSITYAVGAETAQGGVTEISPVAPSYVAGDLLIGLGYRNNDGDCYYQDDVVSWTEDTEYQVTGPDKTAYLAWKIATGSEGTIDFGTTGSSSTLRARVMRVDKGTFDSANPMDAVSTTYHDVNSDTPDPPSITTVTNKARVFSFLVTGNANSSGADRTQPSGYTLDFNNQGVGEFALASIEKDSAGSEDPGTWSGFSTTNTMDTALITFAIRPGGIISATGRGILRGVARGVG